jgi:hypothetical protein
LKHHSALLTAAFLLISLFAIAHQITRASAGPTAAQRFIAHPTNPRFGGTGKNTDIAVGDVDGDGDLDALVGNVDETPNQAIRLWVNNGLGVFSAHPTSPAFGSGYISHVATGDLDRDGDLDAVATAMTPPGSNQPAVSVWLNAGSGVFSPHPISPTFGLGDALDAELGDLDGDSDLDLVVANSSDAPETVWLNDGTGRFHPHPTVPSFGTGYSNNVALGDIDGDGDLDALIVNTYNQAETLWVNDGTGRFTANPAQASFGNAFSVDGKLADLDGDGDLDAVIVNVGVYDPETVWLNNGAGLFTPHPRTPMFGIKEGSAIALGDLDADGDLDAVLAITDSGTRFPPYLPETVWLNDGTGSFSLHPITPYLGADFSTDVKLTDIDGDADLDLLVANYFSGNTVWVSQEEAPPPTLTMAPPTATAQPTFPHCPTMAVPTATATALPGMTPGPTLTAPAVPNAIYLPLVRCWE